ncbi:MAG: OpgC domain-containing protein [Terriglobales bacterium]
MFQTNREPAPEPVLANPEATPTPLDASVRVGEAGRAGAVVAGAAVGAITASNRGLSPPRRDPRVDTLRGLFLIVMMVDHLPHNPLRRLSDGGFGLVSGAEGFVFLSGLVSAWVYGHIFANQGLNAARRRAWHRARDIYLTHLLLYTLALLGGLCGGWQIASRFADFWEAWWHGAVLIYQPGYFSILPMYAGFLLLFPLLLQQMARGRAPLIWAGSIALWLSAQWGIGGPAHNPPWLQLGTFNILAWQLFFIAGAQFGYLKVAELRSPIPHSRALLGFCVVVVSLLFLVRHQNVFFRNLSLIDVRTALADWKMRNHPLRLINFAAYAYILWYLPRSVDERVQGLSVFRLLRYFGRHSLQVFAWSILVSYAAFSFRDTWVTLSPARQVLLALAAAASLACPAWLHERWRFRASQRSLRLAENTATPS